jgi:hypothetical protein
MSKTFVLLLVGISSVMFFISCSKKDNNDNGKGNSQDTLTTKIEITVKNGNSWSAQNTSMNVVSGAYVKVYESLDKIAANTPSYIRTTDQNGKVLIPVVYQNTYYFTVQKGNAKNIYNNFLIAGIFQTDTEIQNSAVQTPTPSVGSLKYADLNFDGIINSSDKATGDYVIPVQSQTTAKISVIYQ